MTAAPLSRQQLVTVWVAQMVGTLVICGVVMLFVNKGMVQLGTIPEDLRGYMMLVLLGAAAPALLYLRRFKAILNQDVGLERQRGSPDPASRTLLRRAMTLGGALCEIPMALGLVQLFLGGETRWFIGATLIAVALRLSYRPFMKAKA